MMSRNEKGVDVVGDEKECVFATAADLKGYTCTAPRRVWNNCAIAYAITSDSMLMKVLVDLSSCKHVVVEGGH